MTYYIRGFNGSQYGIAGDIMGAGCGDEIIINDFVLIIRKKSIDLETNTCYVYCEEI